MTEQLDSPAPKRRRFEVTGHVEGTGFVKHVILADDEDHATAKFERAYARAPSVEVFMCSRIGGGA